MRSLLFYLFPFVSVFSILFLLEENHAPVVKIISPKTNSPFALNVPVQYSISVADKEDGDSKFSEIAANEVLLEVRYFNDSIKLKGELIKPVAKDDPGLAIIKTSNCFNCHGFNNKVIGPSFYDISKRYSVNNSAGIDIVAKRIRNGSSGVWGNIQMPSHPELTEVQCTQIVKWIINNASLSGVNYYTGTEGTFKLTAPENAKGKSYFLLTSSYTDHGANDVANSQMKGEDKIIITSK